MVVSGAGWVGLVLGGVREITNVNYSKGFCNGLTQISNGLASRSRMFDFLVEKVSL